MAEIPMNPSFEAGESLPLSDQEHAILSWLEVELLDWTEVITGDSKRALPEEDIWGVPGTEGTE